MNDTPTQATPQPTPSKALVPARNAPASLSHIEAPFEMQLEPADFEKAWQVANMMAKIRYCGVQAPEEALARIMYGRTLGLSAMAAMSNVFTIEGKPGLEASTMLGICLQSHECEYFRPTETTNERATFVAKRRGQPELSLTWTIDDAKRANLLDRGDDPKKNNWNRYPSAMLRARAITALARLVFPDLIRGFRSTEELRDERGQDIADANAIVVDGETGEVKGGPAPAPRDYAKETAELKARIIACKTKDDFKAIHKLISECTLPESFVSELKDTYKQASKAAREPTPATSEEPKS